MKTIRHIIETGKYHECKYCHKSLGRFRSRSVLVLNNGEAKEHFHNKCHNDDYLNQCKEAEGYGR